MIFNIQRETLLHPLSKINGVVEKKQTLAILGNFYLKAYNGVLSITASDSEVEMLGTCQAEIIEEGEITVPARKFFDICRALPDGVIISFSLEENKCRIQAGKSKFSLATLPGLEFPLIENIETYDSLNLETTVLKRLLSQSAFCMAVQDVRYFLNGLLFEINDNKICCVAADGHRLALSEAEFENNNNVNKQLLIPRKGVLELQKLIRDKETNVLINVGKNHINFICDNISLTSKLIDGNFPDYQTVIPLNMEKTLVTDKALLKSALQRVSILSNEQYKGVKLNISNNTMQIIGHNPEQEQAEETIEIQSDIQDIKTGFNVTYLLDALNAIDGDHIMFNFKDASSSCLIKHPEDNSCRLVVMPIRI
ncbi:MAG: DNA polymerase III subunit beta [Proteobacteria bacterium]|nr:DNA polymerase III subunit beta [Pseudomonadota bacterium]